MKPRFIFLSVAMILIAGFISGRLILNHNSWVKNDHERSRLEKFVHSISKNIPSPAKGEKEGNQPADQPEMAALQEFLMTFDPATGTVPRERMVGAYLDTKALASQKSSSSLTWQGYPADMGGRTRMIMYDPNDANQKKVWAGGVTGGLWYNDNIQDANSTWVPIGDFWSNLSIRCMAYDPNNTQVFYIGTGEVETAMVTYRESSGLGTGIWKSTDGGQTWNQIPSTVNFAYITKIVVRNEGGNSVIYAGVASGVYQGTNHQSLPNDGLFRSTDNGTNWSQVLPVISGSSVPYAVSDVVLGADNRIYVGTRPNLAGQGAATLLFSDTGLQGSWTVNTTYKTEIENSSGNNIPGRVVMATAASDANVVYALIASGYINPANNFQYFNCYHILRSADKGVTWTKKNLPTDLTSGTNFATIAWHALDVAVDPNNADRVYIGGLDIHYTADGGNNWYRVSDWSLMYSGGGPQYIHADQHIIVYKPGSSGEMLFGTDGGVFYTANGNNYAPAFSQHNHNYNTLQFYTCDIIPTAGNMEFIGGLQDNGSLYYTGAPLSLDWMVSGGDGAYCFYDKDDYSWMISSIYYNTYYIFQGGMFYNYIDAWSSGIFVNPADFDYKYNSIYANAVDFIGNYPHQLLRIANITTSAQGTFLPLNITSENVYFSAITYSQYSPLNKTTLYAGTLLGRLFKVTEAQSNSPQVNEIGSPGFPPSNISSIAIGGSEDTLLVTFSNYGVVSVWQTTNGGQSWENKEGNLPDMPIRWALYHPDDSKHCLLATETGVWLCDDLSQASVNWQPVTDGMANVRVDMLRMRSSDNTVLAASHGRGYFTTTWDIITGINEKNHADFHLYPNPSTDGKFQLSMDPGAGSSISVKVYDSHGSLVNEFSTRSAGKYLKQVDLSNCASGQYYIVIRKDGQLLGSEKVVIAK